MQLIIIFLSLALASVLNEKLNSIRFKNESIDNINDKIFDFYMEKADQMQKNIKTLISDSAWLNKEKTILLDELQNFTFSDDFTRDFTLLNNLIIFDFQKIKEECSLKVQNSTNFSKLTNRELIEFFATEFFTTLKSYLELIKTIKDKFCFVDLLINDLRTQKIKFFYGSEINPITLPILKQRIDLRTLLLNNMKENFINVDNLSNPDDFIQSMTDFIKNSYDVSKNNLYVISFNTDTILFGFLQNMDKFDFNSFLRHCQGFQYAMQANIKLCDRKTWKDDIRTLRDSYNTSFIITRRKTIYLDCYFNFLKKFQDNEFDEKKITDVLFDLQKLITIFFEKLFERVLNDECELHIV